jgi:hypothetical protein
VIESQALSRLRQAYLLDPARPAAGNAAARLAGLAKKAGRDQDEFEYLTAAALTGRLTPDTRADLEALYRKAHGGQIDGLEAMLDTRYGACAAAAPDLSG